MYLNSKLKYVGFKREKINEYVSNCLVCKRHQPMRRVAPIIPIRTQYAWERVQLDCVDLRNYSDSNDGYAWIVNVLDCHSKFIFSFPFKNKTAGNILSALKKVVYLEGAPLIVQTDDGGEFNNRIVTDFLGEKNIGYVRGRPRHPQNQGQVERANQTVARKLAKSLSGKAVKRWIDVLDEVIAKYNTVKPGYKGIAYMGIPRLNGSKIFFRKVCLCYTIKLPC